MIRVQETATHLVLRGPEKQLNWLVEDFRFHPKSYFFAVSYQQWIASEGKEGWDGYIYPLKVFHGVGNILRGHKADVIRLAEESGITLDLTNLLPLPFDGLELDDVRPNLIAGKFELDTDQRLCIRDWLQAGIGLHKVTVGGGKSAAFAGAAALIKERFPDSRGLYVTPSERLARQSCKWMKEMLPHFEVGQLGGGEYDYDAKDLVVCTVAMLNKHFHDLKQDGWFETFMYILYDEVHHAPSPTSMKILMAIPAYFRLGASDTSKEEDIAKFTTIRGLFGPVLHEVVAAPLIASGRLARPHIYIVDVPEWRGKHTGITHRAGINTRAFALLNGEWIEGVYKGPVYERDQDGEIKLVPRKTAEMDKFDQFIVEQVPVIVSGLHLIEIAGAEHEIESRWCLLDRMYDRSIIQFKSRNDMIVEWCKYFNSQKWSTVVVATRTVHVYILEALIKKHIDPSLVKILIGYEDDSPEQRDRMFEWFKTTPGAVLITPLVKEGVSINEIQAMIVADHMSDYEVAKQIIGRAMRPKKDNRAHVVWFWDKQHPVLRKGCTSIFSELEHVDGYQFYHPCTTPQSVFDQAVLKLDESHPVGSPVKRNNRTGPAGKKRQSHRPD